MVKIPSQHTLKKYGLAEQDYWDIWERQGKMCPVCKRPDASLYHIDHAHIKGWKKMKPEQRKKYVRGICCNYCNRWRVNKNITTLTAYNAYVYLKEYEERE